MSRASSRRQFVAEIRAAVRRHQLSMAGHLPGHFPFQTAAVPQPRKTSQRFHHRWTQGDIRIACLCLAPFNYEIPLIWLSIAREHESSHGPSGGSCAAGNGAASGRCESHCLPPCAGVCVAGFAPSARHPLNFWCISKRHFNGMALALRVSVDMPVRSRLSPIATRTWRPAAVSS